MRSLFYSCLILEKLEICRQVFKNSPNITDHKNSSSGSRVVPCRQTDRWTDMTKPTYLSSLGSVRLCPGCTTALGLLCNPKYSNQHRSNSPVPLMKRQGSYIEAVLISFGSTSEFPKTLWRWRANALQRQMICCTVSVSFLQNLQVGSPSNRPIVSRCPLTGACPVRIATTIISWCDEANSHCSQFCEWAEQLSLKNGHLN
jgi:hypothetical protein